MQSMAWRFGVPAGLLGAACAAPAGHHGPLPVRNQHPAQLLVLHLDPAPAQVLPPQQTQVRFAAAYSSLWLFGQNGGDAFAMDGETLRAGPQARVGLGEGFEFGIELPFAHTSGGFLDDFLVDYHDWFALPDQQRSTSPRNRFEVVARNDGQTAWSMAPAQAELLDVPLSLTWQVQSPRDGLGLALRAGVELPTGDDRRGYGNGRLDAAVGALAELHQGPVRWYGHLQHSFAGTPGPVRRAGLEFADVTSAGLAAELPVFADLAALVQVEWETSVLRRLDTAVAQRDQVSLWVGGRWRAGPRLQVEVGFGEDLQTYASPDFTAWLGLVTVLGPLGGGRP